jgi:gluconokinase
LDDALDPLVLALDVGSTASRGDVYDAAGRPVEGGRRKVSHAFRTGGDGASEIDPDQVVDELGQIITKLAAAPLQGRVAGVALDTFASSLVGVNGDGRAATACYTYADSRCGPQVTELRRELDEEDVQQRTGCRLHSSYLPARLRWLRESDPDRFGAARSWMSLGEYAYLRMLGTTAAGTATAAWTGLLDRRTGQWDPGMLAAAGIEMDRLSQVDAVAGAGRCALVRAHLGRLRQQPRHRRRRRDDRRVVRRHQRSHPSAGCRHPRADPLGPCGVTGSTRTAACSVVRSTTSGGSSAG